MSNDYRNFVIPDARLESAVRQQVQGTFDRAQYYEQLMVALNTFLKPYGIVLGGQSQLQWWVVYRENEKPHEGFPTIHQMMERVFEIIGEHHHESTD